MVADTVAGKPRDTVVPLRQSVRGDTRYHP
ncbi:hypothetical protein HDA31_000007 [Micromonospora carbonacea subsp. aurantiaca]|nr:hypothetical protein [Micromonospora carbonacea]